jgi:hypothetical protein
VQRELHKDWMTRLKYLPFLMSIGIGLAVNNTKAVFEALFNKESEFARTPKYRIEEQGDEWIGKKYRQNFVVQPLIELALGLYFTATVFYALANGIYGTIPFLVLFQVGFLYTGLLSVIQQYAGESVSLNPGYGRRVILPLGPPATRRRPTAAFLASRRACGRAGARPWRRCARPSVGRAQDLELARAQVLADGLLDPRVSTGPAGRPARCPSPPSASRRCRVHNVH